MNTYYRLLYIIFISCCFVDVNSQYIDNINDDFEKLTVESGLNQNTVNCILKDQHGFVWFGTNSGLNRFDSNKLSAFNVDVNDEIDMQNLHIYDLFESTQGEIWIASDAGLIRYNPLIEKIDIPFELGLSSDNPVVYAIEPESDSLLWLGTSRGVKQLHVYDGIQSSYNHEPYQPNSLSSSYVYDLCVTEREVWIATANGLDVLNRSNSSFNHFTYDINSKNSLPDDVVRSLELDNTGCVLMGTEHGGFAIYDPVQNKFKVFNTENSAIPHNDVRDVFISPSGLVWIATNGGGLCVYDGKDVKVAYEHNPDRPDGLNTNGVYSVYEDSEGVLWVGTYTGGVNYNIKRSNDFKIVRHVPFEKNSICENSVRSMFLDSNNDLWVGTLGGLSHYNHSKRIFTSYVSNANKNSSLSFNTVTTIFEDSKKRVWVGTYSGGINLLNKQKTGFKHYRHDPKNNNTLAGDNIYCIVEDGEGVIWAATSMGLSFYNSQIDNFERVGRLDVRDIKVLSDGNLLLSIFSGLAMFNIQTGGIEYYTADELSPFPVTSMYLESQNRVWLTSQGAGLASFDIAKKEYQFYTKKDGLPSNFISSILPYEGDKMWIGTYNGFSLFDQKTNTFTNYSLSHGLPASEFHPKSALYLPDGNIAFGGSKGMVFFNPQKVVNLEFERNLVMTSFSIDNKIVSANAPNSPLTKQIDETERLVLAYGENDFSFNFVDINFRSGGHSEYLYKLENYNTDWVNIGERTMVAFTNIKPGNYTFKVKVANSDQIKAIDIKIKAPFWMQWYFFVFIIMLIIALAYLYNKYSLISINQKNDLLLERMEYENETELNQMRTRFFTYISHELRTPLTLIIDPLRKAIEINKDGIIARNLDFVDKNTKRLLQLVDQIIDFRKLENDALKLQVEVLPISKVVNDIYLSFEEMAHQRGINYRIESDIGIEGWADRDKIEKIMYNLLTNAFKFTPDGGAITVGLEGIQEEGAINIYIKDTGKGIAKDNQEKIFEIFFQDVTQPKNRKGSFGLGLSYVSRLVKLHYGKIMVDSVPQEGSQFTVTLPIGKDAYSENERCVIIESPETNKKEVHKQRRELMKEPINEENNFPEHDKNTPKIVVVEDEPQLRDYFYISIAPKYKVYKAADGVEGLELIKKVMPDLILSDNMMPIMNGTELCQRVKKVPELEHIPFILVSAWNSDDQKIEGLKVGATDYISKPLDMDLLLAKIESILSDQERLKKKSKSTLDVSPDAPDIESEDVTFIREAKAIIEDHIDNSDFNSMIFEKRLNMSHAVLYRRLKRLTGMSSNEFIRDFRMKRAAQLIEKDKSLKVADVGFKVGYVDTKYFSQCFKKQFGITPTEYKNNHAKNE